MAFPENYQNQQPSLALIKNLFIDIDDFISYPKKELPKTTFNCFCRELNPIGLSLMPGKTDHSPFTFILENPDTFIGFLKFFDSSDVHQGGLSSVFQKITDDFSFQLKDSNYFCDKSLPFKGNNVFVHALDIAQEFERLGLSNQANQLTIDFKNKDRGIPLDPFGGMITLFPKRD